MLGPIFITEQVETLRLYKGQKLVLGPIFIAGQVETSRLYKGQTETCARSNSYCRIGGNLTTT